MNFGIPLLIFRYQREYLHAVRDGSALVRAKVVRVPVKRDIMAFKVGVKYLDRRFLVVSL